MKKVLIVSDSHGLKDELLLLKRKHTDVDKFLHCGDSELSPQNEALKGFEVVQGNCDFEDFPKDKIVSINNYRFYMTHGHLYSVKQTLMKLMYRAEEVNGQIICFGHSHILGAEVVRNKLFINPGSIRFPVGRKERTYVILTLEEENILFQVYDLDRGEIRELRQTFILS